MSASDWAPTQRSAVTSGGLSASDRAWSASSFIPPFGRWTLELDRPNLGHLRHVANLSNVLAVALKQPAEHIVHQGNVLPCHNDLDRVVDSTVRVAVAEVQPKV